MVYNSYLEYIGDDSEMDMKNMVADSVVLEWWKLTDPWQELVKSAEEWE